MVTLTHKVQRFGLNPLHPVLFFLGTELTTKNTVITTAAKGGLDDHLIEMIQYILAITVFTAPVSFH